TTTHTSHSMDADADGTADLCAFCLYPKRDPVSLRCRHSFCRRCMQLYREERCWRAKCCPLCRRSLDDAPRLQAERKETSLKSVSEGEGGNLCACAYSCSPSRTQHWRLTILLLLALLLLSAGSFSLLLIYW
ncbi:hypothetical protein KR222_008259, partial [Zaprionus bogoriensis]